MNFKNYFLVLSCVLIIMINVLSMSVVSAGENDVFVGFNGFASFFPPFILNLTTLIDRNLAIPEIPTEGEFCQYAVSATATSENDLGSLAEYAVGVPNGANTGQCDVWSGYGYSWSPENWDVKSELTLQYEHPVYASSLRIIGDYDMCWNKISLRNSETKETLEVFNGFDYSCVYEKELDGFLTDSIVVETCGWSWSSTDAVELCGVSDYNQVSVEICDWKNCDKGAVSVSVDDGLTSCMDVLEANGFRGTYFLSGTDEFTKGEWNFWNDAFNKGHELASHTRDHWCIELPKEQWLADVEGNLRDIAYYTDADFDEIVTFAYPCGLKVDYMAAELERNWEFIGARGYNYNEFEIQTPEDYFDIRSFNSHGYPGGELEPPNYHELVAEAEESGKWANLVFHAACDDWNVISTLPEKDLWVDTIGNVGQYTYVRDNTNVRNIVTSGEDIFFTVDTNINFLKSRYSEDLSLSVNVPSQAVNGVYVNGKKVNHTFKTNGGGYLLVFDVPFPAASSSVKIDM